MASDSAFVAEINLYCISLGGHEVFWQASAITAGPENLKVVSFSPGLNCLKSRELITDSAVSMEMSSFILKYNAKLTRERSESGGAFCYN